MINMNMQAMMQQAQKLQRDMLKAKKEVEEKTYVSTHSFVTVESKGTKEIVKITISQDSLDKDDIEMLQDVLQVAINEAMKKVDKDTEEKMGKYTKGMPGLF